MILVSANGLRTGVVSAVCAMTLLYGCGQKGNLYLPNDPDFQERAKLPDIVRRQWPGTSRPAATPASAAASAADSTLSTSPAIAVSAPAASR